MAIVKMDSMTVESTSVDDMSINVVTTMYSVSPEYLDLYVHSVAEHLIELGVPISQFLGALEAQFDYLITKRRL